MTHSRTTRQAMARSLAEGFSAGESQGRVARGTRGAILRVDVRSPAIPTAQVRRPPLSGGRLVVHFSRLSRAAAAQSQVGRSSGQCRARLLQHAVEALARNEPG